MEYGEMFKMIHKLNYPFQCIIFSNLSYEWIFIQVVFSAIYQNKVFQP